MSVKFIQTGDVHLDTKFSGIRDDEKRAKRREEHRESFRRIINIVKERQPDFLLITGDLFEHEHFSPDTINFIIQQLEQISAIRVFIIAGNHDPLIYGSPYITYEWPSNVHIFGPEFKPFELNDKNLVIHGVSVTPKNRGEYLLRNYSVPQDDRIHLVVYHGSETADRISLDAWEECLPFSADDIKRCGADWYAVGHYHICRAVPLNGQDIKGYYSGCPEPTKFDETGTKNILQVELTKGEAPKVEKISSQQIRTYQEKTIRCDGFKTREAVIAEIQKLSDLHKNDIIKIVLDGYTHPALELKLDSIRRTIADYFFAVELNNKTQTDYQIDKVKKENRLAAQFLEKIDDEKQSCEPDSPEYQLLDKVKIVGLDALLRREVRGYED